MILQTIILLRYGEFDDKKLLGKLKDNIQCRIYK